MVSSRQAVRRKVSARTARLTSNVGPPVLLTRLGDDRPSCLDELDGSKSVSFVCLLMSQMDYFFLSTPTGP